jgi:hypothetical protein
MKSPLGRLLTAAGLSGIAICACLDHSGAFLARKDTLPPELVSVCAATGSAGADAGSDGGPADAGSDGGTPDGGGGCTTPLTLAPTDGLVVTFSKTMDSRSLVGGGIAILKGTVEVPLALSFVRSEDFPESAQGISSPYAVGVTPSSGRFDSSDHTLLLRMVLSDVAGNPLPQEIRTTFKVR